MTDLNCMIHCVTAVLLLILFLWGLYKLFTGEDD